MNPQYYLIDDSDFVRKSECNNFTDGSTTSSGLLRRNLFNEFEQLPNHSPVVRLADIKREMGILEACLPEYKLNYSGVINRDYRLTIIAFADTRLVLPNNTIMSNGVSTPAINLTRNQTMYLKFTVSRSGGKLVIVLDINLTADEVFSKFPDYDNKIADATNQISQLGVTVDGLVTKTNKIGTEQQLLKETVSANKSDLNTKIEGVQASLTSKFESAKEHLKEGIKSAQQVANSIKDSVRAIENEQSELKSELDQKADLAGKIKYELAQAIEKIAANLDVTNSELSIAKHDLSVSLTNAKNDVDQKITTAKIAYQGLETKITGVATKLENSINTATSEVNRLIAEYNRDKGIAENMLKDLAGDIKKVSGDLTTAVSRAVSEVNSLVQQYNQQRADDRAEVEEKLNVIESNLKLLIGDKITPADVDKKITDTVNVYKSIVDNIRKALEKDIRDIKSDIDEGHKMFKALVDKVDTKITLEQANTAITTRVTEIQNNLMPIIEALDTRIRKELNSKMDAIQTDTAIKAAGTALHTQIRNEAVQEYNQIRKQAIGIRDDLVSQLTTAEAAIKADLLLKLEADDLEKAINEVINKLNDLESAFNNKITALTSRVTAAENFIRANTHMITSLNAAAIGEKNGTTYKVSLLGVEREVQGFGWEKRIIDLEGNLETLVGRTDIIENMKVNRDEIRNLLVDALAFRGIATCDDDDGKNIIAGTHFVTSTARNEFRTIAREARELISKETLKLAEVAEMEKKLQAALEKIEASLQTAPEYPIDDIADLLIKAYELLDIQVEEHASDVFRNEVFTLASMHDKLYMAHGALEAKFNNGFGQYSYNTIDKDVKALNAALDYFEIFEGTKEPEELQELGEAIRDAFGIIRTINSITGGWSAIAKAANYGIQARFESAVATAKEVYATDFDDPQDEYDTIKTALNTLNNLISEVLQLIDDAIGDPLVASLYTELSPAGMKLTVKNDALVISGNVASGMSDYVSNIMIGDGPGFDPAKAELGYSWITLTDIFEEGEIYEVKQYNQSLNIYKPEAITNINAFNTPEVHTHRNPFTGRKDFNCILWNGAPRLFTLEVTPQGGETRTYRIDWERLEIKV